MKRIWTRHGWFIVALVVLSVLAYPAWITRGLPTAIDLGVLNIPQRAYLGWSYRHFMIPFWNPFNFGGQPFFAAGQSGPLYLPNIVFVIFPISIAMKLSYIMHNILISTSTYALSYHLTRSRMGAMLAGLAFLTSGFFVGHAIHTQMYDALAWLPLCFYLFLKLDEKFTLKGAFLLAVVFAQEVLAGHPQMTFHIGLFLGLYTVLKLVMTKRLIVRPWMAIVAGVLLAAPQWLETWHLMTYSNRQNPTTDWLLSGSMRPRYFLQNILPFQPLTGVFHQVPNWECLSYFGVLVLVIGGLALFPRIVGPKHHDVYIFGMIAFVFSALSLGKYLPLSKYILELPGFHFFRFPARYVDVATFSMCLLASYGVAYLLRSTAFYRAVRWALSTLLAALLSCYLLGVSHHFSAKASYLTFSLLGMAAALSWMVRNRTTFAALYTTLGIVELLIWSVHESSFVKIQALATHSRIATYIAQHLDTHDPFQRVADLRDYGQSDSLTLDRSLMYRIPVLNGYDSLDTKWYQEHIALTWDPTTILQNSAVFDLFDVRYVVVNEKMEKMLPKNAWGKVYSTDGDSVWENTHPIKQAWVNTQGTVSLSSWSINGHTWKVNTPTAGTLTISQSYDPNWTIYANGQRLRTFPAHDMLLGVNIPKGTYTLTARYQPTWFYIGGVLSGLVLAAFLLAAIVKRRNRRSDSFAV